MGDPTRYEIFRRIADSSDAFDVSELTEQFALNHNAIRQHLAKLVEAELVVEYRARSAGRGRPRLLYRIDPAVDGRWGLVGPYEKLSLLLAEIVRTGDSPKEVGRRAGRAQVAVSDSPDPIEVLLTEMARQGFDPDLQVDGDNIDARLLRCPFATAAASDPDTVCSLHVGLVEGIIEGIDGFEIDSFDRAEPTSGLCGVHGHLVPVRKEVKAPKSRIEGA